MLIPSTWMKAADTQPYDKHSMIAPMSHDTGPQLMYVRGGLSPRAVPQSTYEMYGRRTGGADSRTSERYNKLGIPQTQIPTSQAHSQLGHRLGNPSRSLSERSPNLLTVLP
jgi:hypothetical protein